MAEVEIRLWGKLSGTTPDSGVVMRIALGICVLLCLAILGFGMHLVLEEQRQVMSFSAHAKCGEADLNRFVGAFPY